MLPGQIQRAFSGFVLIGLWLYYGQYVNYYNNGQVVAGILFSFNQILTNDVYSGNSEKFSINRLRVIPEDDFCQKSDLMKFYHPEMIMEDTYTLRDVHELTRTILRERTFEAAPQLNYIRSEVYPIYYQPIQASILYPYYETLSEKLVYGKQSLCLFHKFNHMRGKQQLSLKQKLMNNFYSQIDIMRSLNLSQDCIDNATYIPQTYRLYHQQECTQFFQLVNTKEFQALTETVAPQFITKLGNEVHRGRGIDVLFPDYLLQLQNVYKFGELCGKDTTSIVAQKYITDPYLYKKHKIEFRIYWFIASSNPLIAYSYKRPLIKRCAKPFDLLSTEKAAHVCNTAIVKQTMDNQKTLKDDEVYRDILLQIEEEEFFIDWSFEGLQERLIDEKKINNNQWLNGTLYPLIYTKLIHLVRSSQTKFAKDSKLSEFFATDFILSDDLQIFILETNYCPQVLSVTPDRIVRNYKMIMDTVEIMNVYLRSRYIRIKALINQIMNRLKKAKIDQPVPNNESIKDELIKIYKDKLDQGIELSDDNLYHKFIDENLQGESVYDYLVQDKCLFDLSN